MKLQNNFPHFSALEVSSLVIIFILTQEGKKVTIQNLLSTFKSWGFDVKSDEVLWTITSFYHRKFIMYDKGGFHFWMNEQGIQYLNDDLVKVYSPIVFMFTLLGSAVDALTKMEEKFEKGQKKNKGKSNGKMNLDDLFGDQNFGAN